MTADDVAAGLVTTETVRVNVHGNHDPDGDGRTPGPWFIESFGIMDATRSRTICMFGDSDQDSADARLVAAAPDLLALVQRLRRYFGQGTPLDASDVRHLSSVVDEALSHICGEAR